MRSGWLIAVAVAAVLLPAAGLVAAQAQAQERDIAALVEQRQKGMKANGRAMKQLGGVFRGGAPYDRAKVLEAAEALAANSGAEAAELFPDDALEVERSEALASIAQERDRFVQLFVEMKRQSEALAALARQEGNDAELQAAFAQLGRSSCSACHTDFRIKN